MADLRTNFVGIKSPNPFWLASAPPTDKEYNVMRAFQAGWGGVVWKTLGEDPHIVNVNGARYGAIHGPDRRLLGLNNIELITDRPLDVNLQEIKKVKREWPDRAIVVSLMVPCEESNWKNILARVEETEAERAADVLFVVFDGTELDAGATEGFGGGKTRALEVLGAELDVSAEFDVDAGFNRVAMEKRLEIRAKLGFHVSSSIFFGV